MNKYLILFTLMCICCLNYYGSAQRSISVENVKGIAFIEGNISPEKARQNALKQAKINALKRADITENINSYQLLYTSQVNDDYTQFFSDNVISNIQGGITGYSIVRTRKYFNKDDILVYEVVIDAEVVRYKTYEDPSFDVRVEGINGSYNQNDKLKFTVETTQSCFLTIFNITDTKALLLYPNSYENTRKISETTSFPLAEVDYILEIEKNKGETETNRLIFVFTKELFEFIHKNKYNIITGKEKIFSWIFKIPPHLRKVVYETFIIAK